MAESLMYLPDGQQIWLPRQPQTWVDAAAGVQGSPLRARTLEIDAGSAVAWHRQRPLFQGIQTLSQSIASSTWTAITPLAELIDNWSGHSDSANPSRYYVPDTNSDGTAGDWYLCTGLIPFSSSDAAHPFTAAFAINGGTPYEGGKVPSGTGHGVTTMAIDLLQMSGGNGDYVELIGRQVTGSNVTTVVTGKCPVMTVRWVCANPAWTYATTPGLPAAAHTWLGTDYPTADLTGTAPDGGAYVPLNRELRDRISFLHSPPIARLTSAGTSQTIPNGGVWTSINMTAESVDNYNGHSTSSNTSRYVFREAGLYFVAGLASISEGDGGGVNTGYRSVRLLQTFAAGGTQAYQGWTTLPQTGSGTTGTAIWAVAHIRASVGDYVELQMAQTQTNATTSRTVLSGSNNCSKLLVVWMAR